MSELRDLATRFIFGMFAVSVLTAMYGPTGWNVLTILVIYAAYGTGRAMETRRRQEIDK